jgi:hypothetical protein
MAKKNTAVASQPEPAADENAQVRYTAWTVTGQRHKNDKGYWTRIGAMFPHKDGEGFNLVLDALPLDGRVIIRLPQPDDEGQADSNEGKGEGA